MYSYVKLNFRVGLFSCIFWLEAIICCFFSISYLPYVTRENGQKWARKSTKSKHGQNCDQKWWIHEINVVGTIFGESLNYKSGLRILIWPLEVPFFWSQRLALLAKVAVFGQNIYFIRSSFHFWMVKRYCGLYGMTKIVLTGSTRFLGAQHCW